MYTGVGYTPTFSSQTEEGSLISMDPMTRQIRAAETLQQLNAGQQFALASSRRDGWGVRSPYTGIIDQNFVNDAQAVKGSIVTVAAVSPPFSQPHINELTMIARGVRPSAADPGAIRRIRQGFVPEDQMVIPTEEGRMTSDPAMLPGGGPGYPGGAWGGDEGGPVPQMPVAPAPSAPSSETDMAKTGLLAVAAFFLAKKFLG